MNKIYPDYTFNIILIIIELLLLLKLYFRKNHRIKQCILINN